MPEKDNKEKREDKEDVDIDFGLGKISFLFKGFGDLIDLAKKIEQEGGIERKGEIGDLPKGARGVYGVSVRSLGGKPVSKASATLRKQRRVPLSMRCVSPLQISSQRVTASP